MNTQIYTIGHNNHLFSHLLELLQKHSINMVVDVRSSPYSKYSSHFNKKPLEKALEEAGINYVYMGNKIGGKPKDKKFYHDDKLIYHRLESDEKYQEGLKELIFLTTDNTVVLLCSEEDPYRCHRHHLISQSLLKKGYNISHIRGDGSLEKVANDYQARLF
ncbi:DUF488 domain-containing protein [Methanobacterium ferruginis]|uniref:DUF488 domain-containing protein n=1 Tax=Methanobacterium ferruginis TaxID=710191 RepID=UPI0025724614|nr:DUF488 domain-containing protein [Methanobacterium ferruginis]BDZ68714.1 hypothetical protein GCM10025860_21620 [Methanobacterium ferruginis]